MCILGSQIHICHHLCWHVTDKYTAYMTGLYKHCIGLIWLIGHKYWIYTSSFNAFCPCILSIYGRLVRFVRLVRCNVSTDPIPIYDWLICCDIYEMLAYLPNRYSALCWRPVTHAQTWASYSTLYRFVQITYVKRHHCFHGVVKQNKGN